MNEWNAIETLLVDSSHEYDGSMRGDYLDWYQKFGMRTIHIRHRILQSLDEPITQPSEPIAIMTYPQGH